MALHQDYDGKIPMIQQTASEMADLYSEEYENEKDAGSAER